MPSLRRTTFFFAWSPHQQYTCRMRVRRSRSPARRNSAGRKRSPVTYRGERRYGVTRAQAARARTATSANAVFQSDLARQILEPSNAGVNRDTYDNYVQSARQLILGTQVPLDRFLYLAGPNIPSESSLRQQYNTYMNDKTMSFTQFLDTLQPREIVQLWSIVQKRVRDDTDD